jgi:NAD(P)-dependent dehydrogenase (short-subunit alcohol dehydrogenase family)
MPQRLLNKVAVITGASGLFGRAIVQRFLAEGAKVVVFARNRGRLEELAPQAPARVLIVDGDVTRSEDLESLALTTSRRFGGVDILVSAAERFRAASLQESTPELVSDIFAVNAQAAIQTVRAFDRHFNSSASIVLLTTTFGQTSHAGLCAFSASKAAVASVARALAVELAPRGIRINCVAPTLQRRERAKEQPPADLSRDLPVTPLTSRAAKTSTQFPDRVAEAVLFLASDGAAGIAGQEVAVDGPA